MQGLNWSQIKDAFFPTKSANACRKRHERLMEKKGVDDWDTRKFQLLAKEYMGMRKEIWSALASKTGEKWNVVEAKVSMICTLNWMAAPFSGLANADMASFPSACPTA